MSPSGSPSASPSPSQSPSESPSASPSPSESPSASPSPSTSPSASASPPVVDNECYGCLGGNAPFHLDLTIDGVIEGDNCNGRCVEKLNKSFELQFNTYGTYHCSWRYSDYATENEELEELAIIIQIGYIPSRQKYYIFIQAQLTTHVCDETYYHEWYDESYTSPLECMILSSVSVPFSWDDQEYGGCKAHASSTSLSTG